MWTNILCIVMMYNLSLNVSFFLYEFFFGQKLVHVFPPGSAGRSATWSHMKMSDMYANVSMAATGKMNIATQVAGMVVNDT